MGLDKFVSTSLDSQNRLVSITPSAASMRPKRRRNRPTVSCLSCKRKKIKCDRMKPMCGACLRNHAPDGGCVYVTGGGKSGGGAFELSDPRDRDRLAGTERVLGPTDFRDTRPSASDDSSTESVTRPPGAPSTVYDESPRIESLLNEIDALKSAQTASTSLWEEFQATSELRAKDFRILRDIRKAHLRPLSKMADGCVRFESSSSSLFFGPSSVLSLLAFDANLGRLIRDFRFQLEADKVGWQEQAASRKCYDELSARMAQGESLVSLLEECFASSYTTFEKLLERSRQLMGGMLPVLPARVLEEVVKRHFQRSPEDDGLHIINVETPLDYSEVALVTAVVKFSFTPHAQSFFDDPKSHLHNENETNRLYLLAAEFLEKAQYRTYATLPALLSLILLYFIAMRTTEKYDLVSIKNVPSFHATAVQMAYALGFHLPRNMMVVNSAQEPNLLSMLTPVDRHTVWCAVMYLDSLASFNLGLPSMIGASADRCSDTGYFVGVLKTLISSYRMVISILGGGVQLTLFQMEKVVLAVESVNRRRLESYQSLIGRMHDTDDSDITAISKVLCQMMLKLRTGTLLLFLYVHGYHAFRDSSDELMKAGRLFGKSLEEVQELRQRLFRRSLVRAVLMLCMLSHLLLNNFCKKVTALGMFSTDLSSIFIRCIYVLCSYIAEAIQNGNLQDTKDFLHIDDLDVATVELLMDPENEDSPDPEIAARFKAGMARVETFVDHPMALLKYLNGFYFNASRSSISRDYNFFASYKYLFLCLSYMRNNGQTLDTLQRDKFMEEYSRVDLSWFLNQ